LPESLPEGFRKTRRAGTAATGINGLHLPVAFQRCRQERDSALETGSDFFGALSDDRIELRRPVVSSDQRLCICGRQSVLALQILAQTTCPHRQVAGENWNAIV